MRLKKKTGKKAGVLALTTALCLLTACGGSTAETVNQAEDSVAAETSQAEEGSENIAENAEAGGEMPEDMSEGLGQGSFYMGDLVTAQRVYFANAEPLRNLQPFIGDIPNSDRPDKGVVGPS